MKVAIGKVDEIKTRCKPQQVRPVLKDKLIVDYLNQIHSKFVLVPIDKAANDIAIICKRFYIEKLLLEIGLLNTPSETYKLSSRNVDEVHHSLSSCLGCLKCITVHVEPGLLLPQLYVPLNHSVISCQQFSVKYFNEPEMFILNASFIRIITGFG